MFTGIKNFLYRHRRKFYIWGAAVGGLVLLNKYAERKVIQWQENEAKMFVKKQQHRMHYEKTRETANVTALSLSSSLTKIVSSELDIDNVLRLISTDPENKLKHWENLKVLGFCRAIATIYIPAVVSCVVHAELMILAGYTFSGISKIKKISLETQEKYLNRLHHFVENGLKLLIKKIKLATYYHVNSLPLNQSITIDKLEAIMKNIILTLSGEEGFCCVLGDDEDSLSLNPWSQYLGGESLSNIHSIEDDDLRNMTMEVVDVVDAEDFNAVVQDLISHGLNHVLDTVSDSFPCLEKGDNSEVEIKKCESVGASRVVAFNYFAKSSLPVAKLLPILSKLVVPCLSPAPGQLLQYSLLNERLENLSFIIYEAFSVQN